MADVAPAGVEKSLDDFFAKRDKKKKKEKGKGKEQVTGGTAMALKKTKREKEKSTKSENSDSQMEKVTQPSQLKLERMSSNLSRRLSRAHLWARLGLGTRL